MAALRVSAFYRHFKAVTSLSPLQCQKHVRLIHARSTLIAGAWRSASVMKVGLNSAGSMRASLACRRHRMARGSGGRYPSAQVKTRPETQQQSSGVWNCCLAEALRIVTFKRLLEHQCLNNRSTTFGKTRR